MRKRHRHRKYSQPVPLAAFRGSHDQIHSTQQESSYEQYPDTDDESWISTRQELKARSKATVERFSSLITKENDNREENEIDEMRDRAFLNKKMTEENIAAHLKQQRRMGNEVKQKLHKTFLIHGEWRSRQAMADYEKSSRLTINTKMEKNHEDVQNREGALSAMAGLFNLPQAAEPVAKSGMSSEEKFKRNAKETARRVAELEARNAAGAKNPESQVTPQSTFGKPVTPATQATSAPTEEKKPTGLFGLGYFGL